MYASENINFYASIFLLPPPSFGSLPTISVSTITAISKERIRKQKITQVSTYSTIMKKHLFQKAQKGLKFQKKKKKKKKKKTNFKKVRKSEVSISSEV